jgi:group I intron endonuclease
MHALCDNDMTVSDEAVGRGSSRSRLTLGQIFSSVPGKLRAGKRKREYRPVIYKLTSPSGKAYVGQTVRPKVRFATHAASGHAIGKSKCRALAAAIAKYGWPSFKKEILVECDKDDLDTMEDEMIRKHGTLTPQGYNLIPGGTFNPIKDPATYTRVRAMWDRGEIQAIQRQAWKNPKLKARMKKVHKERCKTDGGRAKRQGIANLENGNATLRSHSDDAMAKRKATWDAKREAKLANTTEDMAAKVRAQTGRKKTSYAEACSRAGGADKLREKRREWARLRKERTFFANS